MPRSPRSVLTAVLVAGLAGGALAWAAPATAEPVAPEPATTVTHLVVDGTPTIGGTVTLRATVTAADAPVPHGRVSFDAAATEAQLWGADSYVEPYPDASDVGVGDVAVNANGVASVQVTLTTATLPFLQSGKAFFLAAEYQPYDGADVYDTEYRSSTSTPSRVEAHAPVAPVLTPSISPFTFGGDVAALGSTSLGVMYGDPVSTAFLVRYPAGTSASTSGTLTAQVDGESLTLNRTMQGAGSDGMVFSVWVLPARNWTRGAHPVTLHYASEDAAVGAAERTVKVYALPRSATLLSAEGVTSNGKPMVRLTARVISSGEINVRGYVQFKNTDGQNVGNPVALTDGEASMDVAPPDGGISTIYGGGKVWMVGAAFTPNDPPNALPSSAKGVSIAGLTLPAAQSTGAAIANAQTSVSATNCTGGSTEVRVVTGYAGQGTATASVSYPAGAACRAARTAGLPATRITQAGPTQVACRPTSNGYTCPLGSLAPGTSVKASVSFPVPAAAAGKRIAVTTSAVSTHPVTGATSTIGSSRTTVTAPRRTVLKASFAPVRRVASVGRGARVSYRLTVKNAGVVTATKVRACVTLAKGATVRAAHGAKVRGRTACWTIPALKRGATAQRAITFVTPRKAGPLRITTAVTPKRTQASPVRMNAVLTVR